MAPADYSKGSALENSLIIAVDRITGEIKRDKHK